jgi:hypothetical protein
MVNKKTWLGILVMVLIFGMTVVGCDPEPTDDNDYEYDSRPSIPGFAQIDNRYPVVGETITASYDAGYSTNPRDPIGTPSWRWYKTQENASFLSSVTNKTSIGYSNTYTVRQDDVGYWIWAGLSYSGNSGTNDTRTYSTAIGIPATANVSVSIRAVYSTYNSSYSDNHRVTVTLTLSDGRWNNVTYSTASQWITMSGIPSVSSWYPNQYITPSVSAYGRELVFSYGTRSETTLSISSLTATLNTAQLGTMRSSTNVYNTLTAGTPATASVSQWTISEY